MSSSEDEGSIDEYASTQLLQQLDQYVSARIGVPVEECCVAPKQKKMKKKKKTVAPLRKEVEEKNVFGKSKAGFKDQTNESIRAQSDVDEEEESANMSIVKKKKKLKKKESKEEKMDTSENEPKENASRVSKSHGERKRKGYKSNQNKQSVTEEQNSSDFSGDDFESDVNSIDNDVTEIKSKDFTGFSSDDEINSSDFDEGSGFDDSDNAESLNDEQERSQAEEMRQKSIESFKRTVGITEKDLADFKAKRQREKESAQVNWAVPNKYGIKKRPPPEVVVFVPHEKKQREARKKVQNEKVVDLRDAKWEVRRFGTSGLDEQNKNASTLEMLIELGATRPKQKPKNYKVLMQEKRQEQEERKRKIREREMYGDIGLVTGNESTSKSKAKKKKKDKNEISGSVFGQIGREKQGAHVISNRDIRRVNRKRKR